MLVLFSYMSLQTDLGNGWDSERWRRILTFATPVNGTAEVAFGTTSGRYQHTARADTAFFDEENECGFQYIHLATPGTQDQPPSLSKGSSTICVIQGLKEGFTYYYMARLNNYTSPEYLFLLPAGLMKFVVFGDLGFVGGGMSD